MCRAIPKPRPAPLALAGREIRADRRQMFSESTCRACNLGAAALTETDLSDSGRLVLPRVLERAAAESEEGTPSRPKLDHLARSAGIRPTFPKSVRLELVDFPRYGKNHGRSSSFIPIRSSRRERVFEGWLPRAARETKWSMTNGVREKRPSPNPTEDARARFNRV